MVPGGGTRGSPFIPCIHCSRIYFGIIIWKDEDLFRDLRLACRRSTTAERFLVFLETCGELEEENEKPVMAFSNKSDILSVTNSW
jgi:hypothetical protein